MIQKNQNNSLIEYIHWFSVIVASLIATNAILCEDWSLNSKFHNFWHLKCVNPAHKYF